MDHFQNPTSPTRLRAHTHARSTQATAHTTLNGCSRTISLPSNFGKHDSPLTAPGPGFGGFRGPAYRPELVDYLLSPDRPWEPPPSGVLYQGPSTSLETSPLSMYRIASAPSDCGTLAAFGTGIAPSDSGYESITRRSIGDPSVAGEHDRAMDALGSTFSDSHFQQYQEIQSIALGPLKEPWAQPPSLLPQKASSTDVVVGDYFCSHCNTALKTKSELNKHEARHTRPYRCAEPKCRRKEGFANYNDLDRHLKTVHGKLGITFTCPYEPCANKSKPWPRADNFRQHLRRVHHVTGDVDLKRFKHLPSTTEDTALAPPVGPVSERDITLERIKPSFRAWASDSGGVMNLARDGEEGERFDVGSSMTSLVSDYSEYALLYDEQLVDSLLVRGLDVLPERERLIQGPDGNHARPRRACDHDDPAHLSSDVSDPTNAPTMRGKPRDESSIILDDEDDDKGEASASAPSATSILAATRLEVDDAPRSNVGPQSSLTGAVDGATVRLKHHCWGIDTVEGAEMLIKQLEKTGLLRKALENLGYQKVKGAPTRGTRLPPSNPSPDDNAFTCQTCSRSFNRESELRKHMTRHEKPYRCTFSKCHKFFGSKNDWKRHENSRHFESEFWICDVEVKKGFRGGCDKRFHRRETFRHHLGREHDIKDSQTINKKVDSCRHGREQINRFWCGFCVREVETDQKGLDGWRERCNHIDDHLNGRGTEKKMMCEWQEEQDKEGEYTTSPADSDEEGSAPETTPSASEGPVGSAASCHPTQPRKRYGGAADDRILKRSRYEDTVVKIWVCCECHNTLVLGKDDCCFNCPGNHWRCHLCRQEEAPITEVHRVR